MNEIQVDQNGKPNKMSEDDKKWLGLKTIYKGKQIEDLNIYEDNKMVCILTLKYLIARLGH